MGEEQNTENVVRFPRDWVGPPEELVPIGPRARARAQEAERESGVSEDREAIPAAGDFWGEGAAALHYPIEAPSPGPDQAPDAPGADVPTPAPEPAVDDPVATDERRARRRDHDGERPPRRRPRAPQLPHVRRPRHAGIAGAGLAIVAVAAIAIAFVAFRGDSRDASNASQSTGPLVSFAMLRSAAQTGIDEIGIQIRRENHLAHARAVARTERRQAAEAKESIRHRRREYAAEVRQRRERAAAAQSSSQSEEPVDVDSTPSESETPAKTTETPADTTEPTTSDDSSSSVTAASSSGSAPAGPTGVGGATGGCNPQCR